MIRDYAHKIQDALDELHRGLRARSESNFRKDLDRDSE
jgi:hypothetical protein